MARLTIADEHRRLDDPDEIRAFLESFGIWFETWDVAGRLGAQASDEEILSAYGPEIERLKASGGYVTADVINVTPRDTRGWMPCSTNSPANIPTPKTK